MTAHDEPEIVDYRARDGARASMRVFRTDNAAAPVAVFLPAMGVQGMYYSDLARALSRTGLHVVTSDLRGLGTSSLRASRRCDFGYADILERDFPALLEKVREHFPASARWLMGHSLGGQLSALYLSANRDAAEGLVLVASCNVHYKGWPSPSRWGVLGTAVFFRALGAVLGYVPAGRFGFAGDEARTLIVDWAYNCRTGKYVIANSDHDYEQSLQRMQKPVLALSFECDNYAPRPAIENLLRKMPASPITHRHYDRNHPGLENASHFSWARRPAVVAETIQAWMQETGGSATRRTKKAGGF